jgi:SOS-response transcriptional repressor LexA/regulator of protease activity HflC (stomatin/prohibitin superfamily)
MFNLERTLRFWSKVLGLFVPILLVVLVLAVLTAIFSQPFRTPLELLLAMTTNLVVLVVAFAVIIVTISLLAGRFVSVVYNLDGDREGIGVLIRNLFGKSGFGPIMVASQGEISRGQDSVVMKVGGPGGVVTHNDTAVVLEERGKLTRVAGPGLPVLEPFEKIYDVIDLRPKRWVYSVNAMSKEGIPITWDVEVCYQIDDGGQPPTDDVPYPFSEKAVFRAATGKWRRERGRVQDIDWEGWIVISQAEGALRGMLARRHLDELVGLTEAESTAIREAIQQELTAILQEAAPKVGAKILEVNLHSLKVKDEVTEQWIKAWQAQWQSWSTGELASKEAEHIHEHEKAKAEAHILALNTLAEALQKMDRADQTLVLMRLATVLDQGKMMAGSRVFFPGQAVTTLEHIRAILRGEDDFEFAGNDSGFDKGNGVDWEEDNLGPVKHLPPMSGSRTETSSRPSLRVLPLFDEIAAGKEKPVLDDVVGYIQQVDELEFELEGQLFVAKPLKGQSQLVFSEECNYIVVRVSGDSMNRAGIFPGNYVILQTPKVVDVRPSSGDIVAVSFRDADDKSKATLKRIHIETDGVVLQPESSNPEHEPRTVQRGDFTGDDPRVKVVGIALAVLSHN